MSLIGSPAGPRERWVIGIFGVRGIGSLYYLAYAASHGPFPGEDLWAAVGFTVALSVVLHGMTATPLVQHLDAERFRRAPTAEQSDVASTHL